MGTYKTETGHILSALNYKDAVVERLDTLAFWLYTIPINERNEILNVLRYQFQIGGYTNEKFNEILANRP